MTTFFKAQGGTPAFFEQLTINGVVKTLKTSGFSYALVQIKQVAIGDYVEASRIASIMRDGTNPTKDIGFLVGDRDERYFEKGELSKGVKLITAEVGASCIAVVQYYNC